jgi:hypothetical protein
MIVGGFAAFLPCEFRHMIEEEYSSLLSGLGILSVSYAVLWISSVGKLE